MSRTYEAAIEREKGYWTVRYTKVQASGHSAAFKLAQEECQPDEFVRGVYELTEPGLYRVYYTTPDGDGFYAISAVDEDDAIEEGKRLARRAYRGGAVVTGAKLMRPAA